MSGIRINSNNFNGESVEITFNPFSGGSIDLGTQTIPYDYLSSNYEGNYSIYIPTADKTCPLQVGTPPSPTPSPTSSVTPSVTPSITPTITPTASVTVTPTPSVTITPTPSASVPAGDPDATAYISAVETASSQTLSQNDKDAIDTMFTSLKTNGLYSKLHAFYPVITNTAAGQAIEAKGQTQYNLVWNGGMTHDVSGATGNGTNGWANTNFPRSGFTQNDFSAGHYQLTDNITAQSFNWGVRDTAPTGINPTFMFSTDNNNVWWGRAGTESQQTSSNAPGQTGMFIGSRISATDGGFYRNGSTTKILNFTYTNSSTQPTDDSKWIFWNWNNEEQAQGTPTPFSGRYSDSQMNCLFMGEGLTSTEQQTLASIFNTFNTSLGRNTYGGFDSDAQAYLDEVISSGGTVDATISAATDTLFTTLKNDGIYDKLFAFYPVVGGVAASHAINAKVDSTYDLTFAGGWTHDVSGMTSNGSNAYADTNVTPQDLGSAGTGLDNHHMSSSASANSVAGYEGAGPSPYMAQRMKSIQFLDAQSNTGTQTNYWTNVGWQCHNRAANNDFNGWAQADGGTLTELFTNATNATSITSNTLYIGRINGTTFYSGNRYNFWTCGDGLTDTEVSDLNTAINTFNNSLSRRGW